MIGVYGAIFGFIPFYAFVLHYNAAQLIIGTLIGLGIAVSAIEGAFAQMFKFRKRSSYPATILVEVGTTTSQEEAQAQLLDALTDLLDLSGAAVIINGPKDQDYSIPARGLDQVRAQRLCNNFSSHITSVVTHGRSVCLRLNPAFDRPDQKGKVFIAIVPILAWGRTAGVLLLLCTQGKDLKDQELMDGIGVAAGVSLENLIQQDNLQDALSVLRATLDSTADGIIVVVGGRRIASYNRPFIEMWQVPDDILAEVDGAAPLAEFVTAQLENGDEFYKRIEELRDGISTESFDVLRLKDGRLFEAYSQPQVIDGNIVGRVWCIRDVTERVQSEQTIRRLAYHDALTDLPNRALFTDRLTVAIAQARRTHTPVAVLFLDIDRFKMINDTLGHPAGDEVLKAIGAELGTLVREGDTVARVGGDEFTLLLTGVGEDESIAGVAGRILETVRKPRSIGDQELHVTTSLGIAIFPEDGEDVETLLRNADTAMYRAKAQGRDNFQTYTPAMSDEIVRRVSTESDLRRALERSEFAVYYQPQLDSRTWQVTGAEALIRWHHPVRGLVLPGDFISVAEDTGLIVPIGEWVLRAACRDNRAWQDAGLPPITVTVNLSARQFQQANLVQMIADVLLETGLDARYLELEITEGTTIHDPEFAARVIEELRAMGVRVSIDDFGTGYSSLNYLKRFRIDRLKIDRSFIEELTTDPNNAAIATAVIAMAHSLGLGVVAEGVETQEQLDFLVDHQCDMFQGYFIGRPEPESRLRQLLASPRERLDCLRALNRRMVG
jgi:diguanylate cyclase (GGDEF)-like protein/PAS domain S-box-containing protein